MKADARTTRQLPNTDLQAKKTEKPNGTTARALRHAGSTQRVHRQQDKFARRHSESFDTHNLHKGFTASKTNSHGTTARALRHAQSPQNSRQIRTAPQRNRFDTQDLRKGAPRARQIFTAPKRERFNTHNLRRGFAERHAQSPQRVRRAQDKFARRHSASASTRTMSAEGAPSSRHIRTAPQQERFDTQDLRKGCAELKTYYSHGATAKALAPATHPIAPARNILRPP